MFLRLCVRFIQTLRTMKSTILLFTIFMVFLRSAIADPVGTCSPGMNSEKVDFLVDSEDCSVYYKCNWGEAVKYLCQSGLHFNKETGNCDWPELAGCNGNGNNGNGEEVESNEVESNEVESNEIESNEIESNEVESSEKECPDDQCPAQDGEFVTVFPHPKDCGKFCKCDRGIGYDKECPVGLHFNKELNVCDWPENAKCEDDDSTDIGSGDPSSPEIDDGSGDGEGSVEESGESPEIEEGKCPDESCPEVNGEFPVFFHHPETCERYCVCDWGKAYDMPCPDGLHFNLNLNVCDEPENAGCE